MTLNPDLIRSRCAEIEDSLNRLEEFRSVHFDACGTIRPDPHFDPHLEVSLPSRWTNPGRVFPLMVETVPSAF